jgi:hypothetical protein
MRGNMMVLLLHLLVGLLIFLDQQGETNLATVQETVEISKVCPAAEANISG